MIKQKKRDYSEDSYGSDDDESPLNKKPKLKEDDKKSLKKGKKVIFTESIKKEDSYGSDSDGV